MNYCIVMKYSAKENCYIVTVPDLPGCMADGKSPNEAYENVKNVITRYHLIFCCFMEKITY